MNLQTQSLNHYSDFGGTTSESEASEISIVLPYFPKIKQRKPTKQAEGHVKPKGARAMRRYENEAYLNSLAMITEADGEYEADDYWPDKTNEDTGFKLLFEDSTIRSIWDAFISLSETNQITILGSLTYDRANEEEALSDASQNEDFDFGDIGPPRGFHKNNSNNNRQKRQKTDKSARCRQSRRNKKAPVQVEGLVGDAKELESLQSLTDLSVTEESPYNDEAVEYISDSDETAIQAGFISNKLRAFIRKSANHLQRPASSCSTKKHVSFTLQDLCLMHRAEAELKQTFASTPTSTNSGREKPVIWTPSTSLLTPVNEGIQPSKGQPFVLNGFQRMLIHSAASYCGLFSFSSSNDAFGYRQLWVDNRNGTFRVLECSFLNAVRRIMEKQKILS